ncbi:MAG: hybrid sensor histidine kinase/response regulator [Xenococcaceae cyanobacterium MO_167.B27]|nr:hybrid sensor histidine kinase/response regulator [Xenococcaceae cyanobacterium MO_167.B27]
MNTEQQIRLNFLDEVEEYFDCMESNLLGLAETEINPQQIDLVLRSAHSIKGGAAMMGFKMLSQVAHRLEDFLKILRVRYTANKITTEVETLLLQSIDCLRHISEQSRQGITVTESDISDHTQPIFEQLRQHLGDLEAEDEDALMAEDEDVDPALLIFEEGVEEVLERFEAQLPELSSKEQELAQELVITAQELIALGNMANIDPFCQLCKSIQQQAVNQSLPEIPPLAKQALKAWRRSHALVLRGSIEKLPSCLQESNSVNSISNTEVFEEHNLKLGGLQSAFEAAQREQQLQQDLEEVVEESLPQEPTSLNLNDEKSLKLGGLQSAFEAAQREQQLQQDLEEVVEESLPQEPTSLNLNDEDNLELAGLQPAVEAVDISEETQAIIQRYESSPPLLPAKNPSVGKMVRVSAAQLKQFNNLFEQLILDRNAINLRLKQFQNIIALMNERMIQMEGSNTQLKQWYDHASIEGFLPQKESPPKNSVTPVNNYTRFDTLEMDRYSDIHLICQEQIETIVQLQEVTTDLELGLQEITQAVRNLNYTTKSMQGNVTRTQMLSFAEVVKRFPRVIRDLSLQFNKQVNLKIIGENTLLDRGIIEALSDPLIHLLRNAFDHGIEEPQTRIAAGKTPSGTITIQARNQGTYTIITIKDDGRGISIDKIRDRIFQMGIPQSEIAQIPEVELLDFIFEPGFSTAQQVTELSGRGVGMDVVRTNLQEISGDVRVATESGKGTTFTIRIPFSLSILRVAIIEEAGMIFAIPANSIRELLLLESEQIQTSEQAKYINWKGKEIPLVEIEKTLVYRRPHNSINLIGNPVIDRSMALVVGDETFFAALKISRFWNEQESTIRPIDSLIPLPPGVIGSMIFGDGKVLPLFEPILLIEECLKNQLTNYQFSDNFTETKNLSTTKTILIVDDSINVRRYLSLTLEKAGYRVEQAKDGREAVDKLLAGLSVQAVICDIEMPRLDGYGVLEEIKDRPEFANLPIAILTSRSNAKHRKLAMNLGASAYFSKPYNEQKLLDKLAELLQ